jgi:hypothetical protein
MLIKSHGCPFRWLAEPEGAGLPAFRPWIAKDAGPSGIERQIRNLPLSRDRETVVKRGLIEKRCW